MMKEESEQRCVYCKIENATRGRYVFPVCEDCFNKNFSSDEKFQEYLIFLGLFD
jgi:hypothetical protein